MGKVQRAILAEKTVAKNMEVKVTDRIRYWNFRKRKLFREMKKKELKKLLILLMRFFFSFPLSFRLKNFDSMLFDWVGGIGIDSLKKGYKARRRKRN